MGVRSVRKGAQRAYSRMSVRSLSFIAHRPRSFLRAAMGCAFSSQQKSGAMKVNSLPVGYYSASSASVSDMSVPKKRIRGVVFDMDGTLTVPCLDFADMRKQLGILEGDLLDVISKQDPAQQVESNRILDEIETKALDRMELMPGATELGTYLQKLGIPCGLVTRNVTKSVDYFHKFHWALPPLSPALSREFTPYKPSPEPFLHICKVWGVSPSEVLMVGDSAKDDVVMAHRAGALGSVLLDSGRTRLLVPIGELKGEQRPTFVVRSLEEICDIIRQEYDTTTQQPSPGDGGQAAAMVASGG